MCSPCEGRWYFQCIGHDETALLEYMDCCHMAIWCAIYGDMNLQSTLTQFFKPIPALMFTNHHWQLATFTNPDLCVYTTAFINSALFHQSSVSQIRKPHMIINFHHTFIIRMCFKCLYILPLYILCIYSFMYWKSGTSDLLVLMLFVLQCTDYK